MNNNPSTGINNVGSVGQVEEKIVHLKTESSSFSLKNSLLLGSLDNSEAIYSFDEIVNEQWPVQVLFKNKRGEVLVPNLSQVIEKTENSVLLSNGTTNMKFTVENGGVVKVQATNLGENKLLFRFEAKEKDAGQGKVRSFIAYSKSLFKQAIGDDDQHDGALKWAGVDFKYHLFSLNFPTAVESTIRTSEINPNTNSCLLYTSPSPRDQRGSRMPSSA